MEGTAGFDGLTIVDNVTGEKIRSNLLGDVEVLVAEAMVTDNVRRQCELWLGGSPLSVRLALRGNPNLHEDIRFILENLTVTFEDISDKIREILDEL